MYVCMYVCMWPRLIIIIHDVTNDRLFSLIKLLYPNVGTHSVVKLLINSFRTLFFNQHHRYNLRFSGRFATFLRNSIEIPRFIIKKSV
jgi:hypothetical protein